MVLFVLYPSWIFPTLGKRNFRSTTKEESCSRRTTSKTTTDTEQLPQRKAHQLLKWQQENSRTRVSTILGIAEDANDAVSTYTPRVPKLLETNAHMYVCIRLAHGRRPTSCDPIAELVVLFDRNVHGHPWLGLLWCSRLEEVRLAQNGDSVPTRMSLRPSKTATVRVGVCTRHHVGTEGRKRKDIDLADPTPFESGTRREAEVGHEVVGTKNTTSSTNHHR